MNTTILVIRAERQRIESEQQFFKGQDQLLVYKAVNIRRQALHRYI